MRYSTPQDLQANVETFETVSDIIMSDIVREQRAKAKAIRGAPYTVSALIDMDLGLEVGKMTPPVKIYRVGPDGELILKEQIQATTFRKRALESIGGKNFQAKLEDLKQKRRRAGMRSSARNRASRIRLGQVKREPIIDTDDLGNPEEA
jgi:hypothetical protein